MSIWFNPNLSIEDVRQVGENNMGHHIGLQWVEVGNNFLKMSMPVDERTKQPYGLLHGGASCVLAETVGSIASQLMVNPEKFICVGLEINANHVRSARQGKVIATCTPIHIGASTHVWDIKIHDEKEKLICVSRLTTAVLKKP
jgi:1,4-dihydroxy-2-naphthoyl-CoA hydrolase